MKQIGIALQGFQGSSGALPISNPHCLVGSAQRWNWIPRILPFVEQQALFDRLDWTVGASSANNLAFLQQVHPQFVCPSNPLGNQLTSQENMGANLVSNVDYSAVIGDYRNVTGVGETPAFANFYACPVAVRGMIGRWGWSATPAHVTDGLSNTFCIGEAVGAMCVTQNWGVQSFGTTAHPINHMNQSLQANLPTFPGNPRWDDSIGFRSFHPQGAHFLLGDGAVLFVSDSIDGVPYRAMASRKGGEVEHVMQ